MAAVQTPATDGLHAALAARALTLGPARADCFMDLVGTLVHAEIAMRAMADGTFLPAIQMELDHVGAGHHRVLAHVLYQRGDRDKAEAKLKTLRRGESITVRTSLADLRLLVPAASLPNDTP